MASNEKLGEFQDILSYRFRNENLLVQALTHKSYSYEKKGSFKDNETLEFLGDAVLQLAVSHLIMEKRPELTEGEMSKLRAFMVNEQSLAALAREVGLPRFILLGQGEEHGRGRDKPSIISNALEAVFAAVYMDGGFESAFPVIKRLFEDLITAKGFHGDYKTTLQELTQEAMRCTPVYNLIKTSGPDHARVFEVELLISGRLYGNGKGRSKKEAEQEAAGKALEKLSEELRRG